MYELIILPFVSVILCYLFIAEPPSFIEKPARVTKVAEEQTATLVCRVFGAPNPKITWFRGKEPDRVDARFEVQQNGDLIIRVQNQQCYHIDRSYNLTVGYSGFIFLL